MQGTTGVYRFDYMILSLLATTERSLIYNYINAVGLSNNERLKTLSKKVKLT